MQRVTLSKADVYYTCKSRSYLRAGATVFIRVNEVCFHCCTFCHLHHESLTNLSYLRLRLTGRIWPVTCTSSPKWTVTNMCQLWRWPTWTTSKSSARTWSWSWTSYDVSDAFKAAVLCSSYFSRSSIRTRHYGCLPERAACQENLIRVNFYQHVVGVDFPGEVVKVHPAESYLLVFDLCSHLVYCLN